MSFIKRPGLLAPFTVTAVILLLILTSPVKQIAAQIGNFVYSNDTGAVIPDDGCPTMASIPIDVTDDFLVDDVQVGINLTSPNRGDIMAKLEAPSGTQVLLIAADSIDNNINYDLLLINTSINPADDETDDDPNLPYYDRQVAPANLLNTLHGENASGTWTLLICDDFSQNDATLNRWSLFLSPIIVQTDIPLVLDWSSGQGDVTNSVAWGDYDNDGDLDLAVGNSGPNSQNQVYRNDGGILTTQPIWSSNETDNTLSVAWGDYDNDGDLDLAVGNNGQNRVYRNEDGILTSSSVWSSSESDDTSSIEWGDYDNDGDLDLTVGNNGQPNRLYRNDTGILTTNAVWSSIETDNTLSVSWGDVDGDGDLDLAVGNGAPILGTQPNRLYRNNAGNLTTGAIWSSFEADFTSSVRWGDYDSDGDLDLVVGNWEQPNRLYRNDGGALTINWIWSSDEADQTSSVAWGDYDGDGDLDLAVGNHSNPNRVYRNNAGMLTNKPVWSSTAAGNTASIIWGDYDNDGDLDIALGNVGQANQLYRNERGKLTVMGTWSSFETDTSQSIAWGDLDGDGDLDLAVGNDGQNRVYRNDNGTLTSNSIWSSNETDNTWSVAWGDLDSDGDLDLAVGNDGQNRVYRNDNGMLTSNSIWSSNETDNTSSVLWGDYDGDGDLDLAVGNDGQSNRLYRNDNGTLTTSPVWSSNDISNTLSIDWGDYDNDIDLDLAVGNIAQKAYVYANNGGILNNSPIWESLNSPFTSDVAWGDFDGDGDLDLILTRILGSLYLYENSGVTLANLPTWSANNSGIFWSMAHGDYDGDGDLDVAVGDLNAPAGLYTNNIGTLAETLTWSSYETDVNYSLAWGDVDGDGDLDLAVANGANTTNRVYQNLERSSTPLMDDAPYVTISRPGNTADASFYSTSEILQTANVPISYKLFDPEGDIVPKIFPEYSPTGGGQWFPATPGPGGDGLTNLAASPGGTPHTFIWNTEADLIRSDNVIFRIRAQPGYTHSPILWPAQDGKSPPFRVAAPWYIKVVDNSGKPISSTLVYANGQPLGSTNHAGLLNPGPLNVGTPLVALAQVAEQPTIRAGHDGWAYRTYLTNLGWDDNGQPQPFIVNGGGEQRLVVGQPLVLFNLLVSVEWDATDDYLNQIERAMQSASDYLYDLTDGQMAFGQVHIYDNSSRWAEADLQISTKNIVRPHAYIGGITSTDKSHVIRVGRYWDGDSGNQGPWDQPEGFRTLAHEFGHYGLHLYDEYFAYTFDQNGNVTGEVPAYCTAPKEQLPADDSASASAMYRQYDTTELSARDVPGLWSVLCEQTAQWQFNGESTWETLARKYADTQIPARWQLTTPADRGSVLAGPQDLPSLLPDWPQVEVHQAGPSTPTRQLTVYGPLGPYWGAIVALYKSDGRVIGQGFTDSNGRLDVYGAIEGDTLRASSFDSGLAGKVTIGTQTSLSLILEAVGGLGTQAVDGIPHLRVVAEPSQDPNQIDLLVFLHNFGAGADPNLIVTEPGSEAGFVPNLSYSPSTNTYKGEISFSATERGMGRIRAAGEVGGSLVRLQSTYRLQRVVNNQGQEVFSNDGNLSLHLEAGSLPSNEAYLVVMPPGAVPGPLPANLVLVGDAYDITASGALVDLEGQGVLKLGYDGALVKGMPPEGLNIYRWEPSTKVWQIVGGNLDEEQQAVIALVPTLGTYALLAPSGPPIDPTGNNSYLPIILK